MFGQHRELPFTQRHRNTNTSVCKRILRSQVWKGTKVLIFFFFFQSQFSQGKLNWHELLKTSWAQDHLGTEKKTEARIPNQSVSCRACALTSPPYRCLLASLSAISVLPESTDIPLTWNIIFPSPYLQWAPPCFCPIHTITEKYDKKKKDKTAQSTKCFANSLPLVKDVSKTPALKMSHGWNHCCGGVLQGHFVRTYQKASQYLKEKVQNVIWTAETCYT